MTTSTRPVIPFSIVLGAVAAVLVPGSSLALQVAPAGSTDVKRADLQRHDLSIPGREVIQVLVELAPGVTFPPHSHPGEEVVFVLEGTLQYEVEGMPTVTLEAGQVLFIPAGAIHAARNVGPGKGVELATYIVEKDKPLLVPAR